MNKNVIFILAMSIVVFGAIAWMAGSRGSASTNAIISDPPNAVPSPSPSGPAQVVSVRAEASGYDHPRIQVKAGQQVEFHFSASPNSGCGRQLILDGFGVNLVSRNGEEQVARFTPSAPGTYSYHCGMNMFVGWLNVVA